MKLKAKIKYITFIISGVLLLSLIIFGIKLRFFNTERRFPSIPSKHDSGVIYYNKSKASSEQYFIMSGSNMCIVYSVLGKFIQKFPGGYCHFDPKGYFISAINGASFLYFFNKKMDVIWKLPFDRIHHDVQVDETRKEIAVVTSTGRHTSKWGFIEDHGVSVVDYSGKIVLQWSVFESLKALEKISKKKIRRDSKKRLFKINSVQIIPENESYKKNAAFKPGNLLINIDLISMTIVLNREDQKIIWSHIYPSKAVHSPRILRSGHMLYFNNQLEEHLTEQDRILLSKNKSVFSLDNKKFFFVYEETHKLILYALKKSSVDIINPITKELLWRYSAPVTTISFASPWLGLTQLLKNGNILVSHITHGGSAFEVTPKGEIVWEWVNNSKYPSGRPRSFKILQKLGKEAIEPFLNQTF